MNFQLGNISGGLGNGQYYLEHELQDVEDEFLQKCRRGLIKPRSVAPGVNGVAAGVDFAAGAGGYLAAAGSQRLQ